MGNLDNRFLFTINRCEKDRTAISFTKEGGLHGRSTRRQTNNEIGGHYMLKLHRTLGRILFDLFTAVFALPAGLLLARARYGWGYMRLTRKMLYIAGLFPMRRHYYEPVVYPGDIRKPLDQERDIRGLDLNAEGQLALLKDFQFQEELRQIPVHRTKDSTYNYRNGSFEEGDGEFLYNVVRNFKPRRIIEIGSGNSTAVTQLALAQNRAEDAEYECRQICVEPYEAPMLERMGVEVIRERVELCDLSLFDVLEKNDILFIDSSHVIRPQGDVLFEYLEVLGRLRPGVIVHVHDIFTPRDYLEKWIIKDQKLWNEQYLLEAFLCFNKDFRVIGALNWLQNNHREALAEACPIIGDHPASEPRSFWMMRN